MPFWLILLIVIISAILLFTGELNALLALCLLVVAVLLIPGLAAFLLEAFPALSGLSVFGAGSWVSAAVALTGAYMLHPATVESVIESVGDVASEITSTIVDVGADVASALFSKIPFPIWLLGGYFAYRYITKEDDESSIAILDAGSLGVTGGSNATDSIS